ncbi:hypothetical protein BYT27DRAFT_7134085 [Phlegmacium glaucopus]|nr:hypothetical protein BYT27DRAFT_7134085 [Phlegmacium glaucopus]
MAGETLDIDDVKYPKSLSEYVASYMFEILLYGAYNVLFVFSVYLLLANRKPSKWFFLAVTVAMFAITTADISMTIYYAFHYVFPQQELPVYHAYPKYLFYVTNNVIADSLILYRCYVVWRYKKILIIIPCIALLFSTMCGYLFVISRSDDINDLLPVYLWLVFALNASLTILTAGKIIWNARQIRSILGSEMAGRYYSYSAVIIESGAILSMYILLDLLVPTVVLDAGLIQVVGIVPTLIIIRVGLGRCTLDAETIITLHREEERQSSTPVLDSIFSSVGAAPVTEQPTAFNNAQTSSCIERDNAL